MPRTTVLFAFWYGDRIASSRPGSFAMPGCVVFGSRSTCPASTFVALSPSPPWISFFRSILK